MPFRCFFVAKSCYLTRKTLCPSYNLTKARKNSGSYYYYSLFLGAGSVSWSDQVVGKNSGSYYYYSLFLGAGSVSWSDQVVGKNSALVVGFPLHLER
jgi:hypothetical protein